MKSLMNTQMLVDEAIEALESQINDTAIIACSGGIDSTVAAVLAHRAVGSLLHCVYVDTGFMRKGETEEVREMFKEMGIDLQVVDASVRFFTNLEGVTDPEEKRKVIGEQFIRVFEEEQSNCGAKFLVQGTIAPDWIESGGGERDVIKSHHNVGGLPEEMELDLVEPLRDLFKDEVRRMGLELGIPKEMLERHPFPGPGLGVRIIGEITVEKTLILQEADNIFIEELIKADLYDKVSQAFAVLLPVKSVGVVGDERRYAEVIGLRAVETVDFMTARWAHLPYEFLEHVSNRIVNEIEQVSRVVYDISSKPPATIEWE